jgi:NAD-dependent dihydropyrimidine dehydrogenase PreA subunit
MCSACSACVDACPMTALKLSDVAEVDKDICIGCAVCVSTCDLKAIKMARRK